VKAPNAPKNNLCRAARFELRAEPDGDGFTLEGYAAVFGEKTRIDSFWEGTFDEVIQRGSFAKTLKERTPVLQFDHGHDMATGSVPIGAIDKIREDAHGLFVQAQLHDNTRVEPIRQAIASGAIDGMSFRFRVIREEWDESDDLEVPLRTIKEVELFELGPVVFPAYASTSVGVRSLLAGLADEDRRRLVADLRAELSADAAGDGTSADQQETDAAGDGTSEQDPDAGRQATSGMTPGEREAFFRSLLIRKDTAA
jgi:HK97 family phage prohead protease